MIIVYSNCFSLPVIKEIDDEQNILKVRKIDDDYENPLDTADKRFIDMYKNIDDEYAKNMIER